MTSEIYKSFKICEVVCGLCTMSDKREAVSHLVLERDSNRAQEPLQAAVGDCMS